jgi:hypothetical protein
MKFSLTMIFFILSILVAQASEITVRFDENKVKQGSLASAEIILNASVLGRLKMKTLKALNLGDILYVYEHSTFIRLANENNFKADAYVLFTKVPQNSKFIAKIAGESITVDIGDVEVFATETSQDFLFGDFVIPEPVRLLRWLVGLLFLLGAIYLGYRLYQWRAQKVQLRRQRERLKQNLTSATGYDGIIEVWEKKHEFIQTFPQIQSDFENFQQVIFQHQFKRTKTDTEKQEIINAYRDFVSKISGGVDGI